MIPPVLTTERLTLRGLALADAPVFTQFYATEHSAFYGGPTTPDQAWRKLAMYAGHWLLRGYGPWALDVTATGETVGVCGGWYPEGWPEPEITYFLLEGQDGKGYATEALAASLDWIFAQGWPTVISSIHPDNVSSRRLAERCGAFKDGQAEVPPHGLLDIYRYPRPEAA